MPEDAHALSQGKWPGILLALGVDRELLNKRNQPCPRCGGKDRFRFTDHENRGLWVCSGACGAGNGYQLLELVHGWDFKTALAEVKKVVGDVEYQAPKDDEAKHRAARERMWKEARYIEDGDPADVYLKSRGLGPFKVWPKSLRFHERECMMLAAVTLKGRIVQVHRTFLTLAGEKRERRMMPGRIPKGCCVPLSWPPGDPVLLGIAEGIETAMAANLLHSINIWSALNTWGMENWEPPSSVKTVWVFADNDPKFAGHKAAWALAHRMACEGKTVRVLMPDEPGTDWNDVLVKKKGPPEGGP